MKKKTSFQLISSYSSLLITVFVACSLIETGCGNAGGQTTSRRNSHNWITMNITFKPNTDEEFREKAIKDIEKMWIKEAAPFRKQDPSLYPTISVTEFGYFEIPTQSFAYTL